MAFHCLYLIFKSVSCLLLFLFPQLRRLHLVKQVVSFDLKLGEALPQTIQLFLDLLSSKVVGRDGIIFLCKHQILFDADLLNLLLEVLDPLFCLGMVSRALSDPLLELGSCLFELVELVSKLLQLFFLIPNLNILLLKLLHCFLLVGL